MKKTFAIGNTIALIITIAINYLSNSGMLNGNTMETISDRYENYFTPAGYAFSIWGLIYLGLASFIYYNWSTMTEKGRQLINAIGWWFIVSCIANSAWVVAWLSDEIALSVCLMILLFVSLLIINQNILRAQVRETDTKILLTVKWPFAIYFGWVSVALIANTAALLTKLNWDGWGISGITWTIIMVCIAGIVNTIVLFAKKLPPFALVGIWALIAISVSNNVTGNASNIVYACYIVSALLLIMVLINTFKNKPAKG